ncbi:MAG: hypothetical protein FJX72_21950 [Armatimonadetes bacterium]|nr:hypothetical protein [Armatimonadota bacterium]
MDIAEGNPLIEIGTPGLATLTIVDNDSGTPTAHFEIAEDIPLDQWGRLAILSEPGASRDLEVVVDALPPGGAAIHYTSTADGQIHTLLFTDQPRQTIQVTAPAVTPGHAQAIDELQILNPPTSKSTRSGGVANCSVLLEQLPQEVRDCLACVGFYFMAIIGNYDCQDLANACNFDPVYHCPPLAAAEVSAQRPRSPGSLDAPAALEILRRYRDEILVGAQGGDYYIQLYREQSPLIGAAILQRPTLIHSFAETWDLWLPAITAQVDGQGSSFVITGEMQGALLGIMTEFAEVGGPDLASLMADFREALDLENIAGFTADDLQQRIESNEMNEERATWGEVKSMFR